MQNVKRDGWMNGQGHMVYWRGDAYQADEHGLDLLMATEAVATTAPDLEERRFQQDLEEGDKGKKNMSTEQTESRSSSSAPHNEFNLSMRRTSGTNLNSPLLRRLKSK